MDALVAVFHNQNDNELTRRESPQSVSLDKFTFEQLPLELQDRVAFWVSMRRSEPKRKVSRDLGYFRLGCRRYAELGARLLARESLINPRSSYRGITINFTIPSLLKIEALVKNAVLAASITNVYLVKWQLRASSLGDCKQDIIDFLISEAPSGVAHEDLYNLYLQRQEFFSDRLLLSRLVDAIKLLPNLKNTKWIEDRIRHLPSSTTEETGTIPSRQLLYNHSELSRDLPWHSRHSDSFHSMVRQWTYYNKMLGSLRSLMCNVTHLHLRGSDFTHDWAEDDDGNTALWMEIVQTAQNLTCFQFNSNSFEDPLLRRIFQNVTWPRLRKVFFIDGIVSRVSTQWVEQFLLRHRETLAKVRLNRPEQLSADSNLLKSKWWNENFHDRITFSGKTRF